MDELPLPSGSSEWLRETYLGSKLVETKQAIREAKLLVSLLRRRAKMEKGGKSIKAPLAGTGKPPRIVWKELGQSLVVPRTVSRSEIIREGTEQGWQISVILNRKSGDLRAMAIGRMRQARN